MLKALSKELNGIVTQLWYFDVESVQKKEFDYLLDSMPFEFKTDILRYKFVKDQKLKLYGRILVQRYCMLNNIPFNWSLWKNSSTGKPFVEGIHFNISHSGTLVVVGFSQKEIGVDVEHIKSVDISGLIDYLHEDEKKYVELSTDKTEAFYHVWTRKEAYLKLKGEGIVNGLNHENCLPKIVLDDSRKEYAIQSLPITQDYILSICQEYTNGNTFSFDIVPKSINDLKII